MNYAKKYTNRTTVNYNSGERIRGQQLLIIKITGFACVSVYDWLMKVKTEYLL